MLTATFDLSAAERVDRPFPHVRFAELTGLTGAVLAALVEDFPAGAPLTASARRGGGDKTYAMHTATVHEAGRWSPAAEQLAPRLRRFLGGLVDSDYRHRLAGLLGLPDGPVDLEVRLSAYPRGGWLSRHTDRPDKLFSQNVYLCPGWRPEWGGDLALHHDEHGAEPAAVFTPGAGNSLAFARSDRSWHEVRPVSASARFPRRTVLIHGYRPPGHPDHRPRETP